MKFRRNAPVVLIGAVVLVVAAMAVISNRLFSGLTESIEESQFELMKAIVAFNIRGTEGKALARAEMIASMPAIQEAFAAQSRERLQAECTEMFRIQKEKYGVDQANFHGLPAVGFLRLQAPTLYGDDLTKFRPIVVAVNKDQISRSAFGLARTGPAIFGTVPVRDKDGKHVGCFEIGIDPGAVLDSLKAAYGLEMALFIEEQPLKDYAKGINPEILSDQNRLSKYMKVHATNWGLLQNLVKAKDLAEFNDGSQYTRDAVGTPFGVVLVPVRNVSGVTMGVLAIAKDFSASRAAEGRSLVWQCLLALFAIGLLTGAILVVLRGFLLRPLGELEKRFAALAAGDREQPMENSEKLCEEMRELAGHYERLRTQPEPASSKPADGKADGA